MPRLHGIALSRARHMLNKLLQGPHTEQQCYALLALRDHNLTGDADKLLWKPSPDGRYNARSAYLRLTFVGKMRSPTMEIWTAKVVKKNGDITLSNEIREEIDKIKFLFIRNLYIFLIFQTTYYKSIYRLRQQKYLENSY
jgi:hypothetical protein